MKNLLKPRQEMSSLEDAKEPVEIRITIPPTIIIALVFCELRQLDAIYTKLKLKAYDRLYKVDRLYHIVSKQVSRKEVITFGYVPVDCVGEQALDELKADVLSMTGVISVDTFLIR